MSCNFLTGIIENSLFTIPTSTVIGGRECVVLGVWPSDTISVIAGVLNTLFQVGIDGLSISCIW